MRIAILADIHGNHRALQAVMACLPAWAPDVTVNLGDHLSGPLQAAAVADLLMPTGWLHIRGNHDRQLLDRPQAAMGPSDAAAAAQLTPGHRAWLAGLPATARLGADVLLCHGTPTSDTEYLLEAVTPAGEVHLASAAWLDPQLASTGASLVLCGHSHLPRLVRHAGVTVVNPGSVGLPAYEADDHVMETGSPHARFALADRVGGAWRIQFPAVEYDWDAAAEEARRGGREDWARALATGRVR